MAKDLEDKMKKLLIGLLALGTISAQASMLEIAADIQEQADVAGITINKDGSVTIKDISVKRGDLTYPVALEQFERDYTSTCKLLGFDNSLTGTGLNDYSVLSGSKVFLETDGTYSTIKNHNFKIDKVTCFKEGQLKTVVLFDKIDNADKSSKITNISYLRGDLTYPVAVEQLGRDYTSTCKLLGFDNSLTGTGLNDYSVLGGSKVFLKTDGTYSTIKNHKYKINKVTCFSGTEPSLVVLVSGNRYMRVIP